MFHRDFDNFIKRTLTGIVIVALIVGFLLLRKVDLKFFDIFLWVMAVIGTFELHRAFGKKTTRTQKSLAILYAVTIFPVALFVEKQYTVVVAVGLAFVLVIISTLIINHLTGLSGYKKKGKDIEKSVSLEGVGLTILTLFYPSIFLFLLHYLSVEGHSVALILAFVVSPCTDVAAYFVGSLIGGKKLCPIISPKKTISGAIGGFLGGILGSIAVYFLTGYFAQPMWNVWADVGFFAAVGFVCAFLTEFGDLVESQIKRKLGVKDMGRLLPGHGGVMDRIDGLLFASAGLFLFFGVLNPPIPLVL